jgi:lipid A 3-O-deacylase
MMKTMHLALAFVIAFATQIQFTEKAFADSIDRLSLGVGYFDVFDDDDAVDFRIEYRPGAALFWQLKPWIGGEITSDGGLFGGAGFLYDFHLGNQWVLTPNIGAGLFSDGDGKDMNTVQFRSQIELGYQFQNASRLSAALSHFSGGDAQVLGMYYHIPMNWVKQGPGSGGY